MPRWSNVVVTGYTPYMQPRIQILPHTARILAARQLQRTNKNMLKTGFRNFLLKFPCRLFHFVNCNITTIKLPKRIPCKVVKTTRCSNLKGFK